MKNFEPRLFVLSESVRPISLNSGGIKPSNAQLILTPEHDFSIGIAEIIDTKVRNGIVPTIKTNFRWNYQFGLMKNEYTPQTSFFTGRQKYSFGGNERATADEEVAFISAISEVIKTEPGLLDGLSERNRELAIGAFEVIGADITPLVSKLHITHLDDAGNVQSRTLLPPAP